jgi:hypothetical protein
MSSSMATSPTTNATHRRDEDNNWPESNSNRRPSDSESVPGLPTGPAQDRRGWSAAASSSNAVLWVPGSAWAARQVATVLREPAGSTSASPSSAGGGARVGPGSRVGRLAGRSGVGRAVAGQPGHRAPRERSGAARRSPSVGRCPAARRSWCWRRPQPPAEGSWPRWASTAGSWRARPTGEGRPGRQGNGEGSSNRHGQNPVRPPTVKSRQEEPLAGSAGGCSWHVRC